LDAGQPRVLTADATSIVQQGGWTGLDRETIEAVRAGAQPGDPHWLMTSKPAADDDGIVWMTCCAA
jgi:hypothetical protein